MDNLTTLFIRACKSTNPERRIKRIYSSAYYADYSCRHANLILMRIVEEYDLLSVGGLAKALDPNETWRLGGVGDGYDERLFRVLLNAVRLCHVGRLDGYRPPAKFREN